MNDRVQFQAAEWTVCAYNGMFVLSNASPVSSDARGIISMPFTLADILDRVAFGLSEHPLAIPTESRGVLCIVQEGARACQPSILPSVIVDPKTPLAFTTAAGKPENFNPDTVRLAIICIRSFSCQRVGTQPVGCPQQVPDDVQRACLTTDSNCLKVEGVATLDAPYTYSLYFEYPPLQAPVFVQPLLLEDPTAPGINVPARAISIENMSGGRVSRLRITLMGPCQPPALRATIKLTAMSKAPPIAILHSFPWFTSIAGGSILPVYAEHEKTIPAHSTVRIRVKTVFRIKSSGHVGFVIAGAASDGWRTLPATWTAMNPLTLTVCNLTLEPRVIKRGDFLGAAVPCHFAATSSDRLDVFWDCDLKRLVWTSHVLVAGRGVYCGNTHVRLKHCEETEPMVY